MADRFEVPAHRRAEFEAHCAEQAAERQRVAQEAQQLQRRATLYEIHFNQAEQEQRAKDEQVQQELAVLKEHLCVATQRSFVERFFREASDELKMVRGSTMREVYNRITHEFNRYRPAILHRMELPEDFSWPHLHTYLLTGLVPPRPFLQYYRSVFVLGRERDSVKQFFRGLADRYGARYEELDMALLDRHHLEEL